MTISLNTRMALLLALPLALTALPAQAEPTALASVPLMSLTGSGTVKPNIMMLYDDSGSMAYHHTPDYITKGTTCRARTTMGESNGERACEVGDVPYATPQFNRQYYNPKTRYLPPVKADRTTFASQDRSTTGGWTSVTTDGYSLEYKDLRGSNVRSTNLVTGFPDLEWCDSSGDCRRNTIGYTYPTTTYRSQNAFTSNPYYYTLNVNEYCTDETLTTCVSSDVNASAPDTRHTVPAPVRWCNSSALTTCQAKYTGAFVHPRFGDPGRNANSYTTITINDSGSATAVQIDRVSSSGTSGTQTITNGVVGAANGTNTAAKRAELAAALAASINAKTGLDRAFMACVRSTTGTVPACSTYNITVPADNVVAVFPVSCPNRNSKNNCTWVKTSDRTSDVLTVHSPDTATALLRFTGRSANENRERNRTYFYNLDFGGLRFFSRGSNYMGQNWSASQVVSSLASQMGTNNSVKAYIGGNSITPQCAAANQDVLCLVGPASVAGDTPTIGGLYNSGSLNYTAVSAVSNTVPTSVSGFDTGVFIRTDIVPGRTFPKTLGRTDCQGDECTYDEEMTNFANWYAYYKSRNQMMKTSVGHAFESLDKDYKVGLVGLQYAAGQKDYTSSDDRMHYPQAFTGEHRKTWYDALYAMNSNGGTPVRQALHAIGNMFANKGTFKQAKGSEVVEFACQQNFTFVTTDGYWNGPTASGVENNDNKENAARFCTAATGCYDPSDQKLPSLADVALYWYNGGSNDGTASLNQDLEGEIGQVPGTGNKRLHMRTYALGLGVDGIMKYEPKYDTELKEGGDLYNIINQVPTGCPWNNQGAWRWPDPDVSKVALSDTIQARVDDLWHAAINGGGKYFSASDPQQVVEGLNEALNDIRQATGAASAAATSTPNIKMDDADIFTSTFTTVKWTGNLTKRTIDALTGIVSDKVTWSSSWTVGEKVKNDSDTRSIWYRDPTTGNRTDFTAATMGATEKAWFTGKCTLLSQCNNLSAANKTLVNQPETLVNWLRGQQQYADGTILRGYSVGEKNEISPTAGALPVVLGDIASSSPAYLRGVIKSYDFGDYGAFDLEMRQRKPTVFIAANDGMLHAFDGTTGEEMWGYVPRITMKKLAFQASLSYGTEHQFTTDGSPELADVQIKGKWRTVLVAGLNAGGRGYYALDVTDPANPLPLWEICADSTVCSGAHLQPEMGLTFGNPMFGRIKDGKDANGNDKLRWVVFLTSGYNNIPGVDGVDGGSGKGMLFVVDVETGEQIKNLGESGIMSGGILTTGSGDTTTPSGFAKITATSKNPEIDPNVQYVYAGDVLGQMWRFDFTGATVKRIRMGNAGPTQPITTRPEITTCRMVEGSGEKDVSKGKRVVVFGTGRMLDYSDIQDTAVQSLYVLTDNGVELDQKDWRKAPGYIERKLVEGSDSSDKSTPQDDEFTIAGDAFRVKDHDGWFVDLKHHTGERVNLAPRVVSGTLAMVTNVPQSSTACTVGGTSYAYQLNVCTGQAVPGQLVGEQLSNDAAAVGFIIVRLPNGSTKIISTTAKGDTITRELNEAESGLPAYRTGWRRIRD